MEDPKGLVAQIDALFHPESVAIVGLPRGMKAGKLFLLALLDQGYPGSIYPVHPEASEIDGLKAYRSVKSIPGSVDLAIVLVPHGSALPVVKECAAAGAKGTVLFTAGYKETGTEEGIALEKELTCIARSSGMRLIGPNCMGLYCPASGLSFFPGLSKEPGKVGLISHSGSLANILCRVASQQGVNFSKAVSLGNECDLASSDFLEYMANDPETEVIGAYLEGIKHGPRFLASLAEASRKKPAILWKVGLTSEGRRAASSHTGAMASSGEIWEAVTRQNGAITVTGFDALLDTMMGFSMLPPDLGDRVAILSGPGGLAVAAAEACGKEGLRLAALTQQTRSVLAEFVPPTGTSLANPVDVGLTASLEMDIYVRSAEALASDPSVDAVLVIGGGMSPESNQLYRESMIRIRGESGKPFMIVGMPGFDPLQAQEFCDAGIPFFETCERAMEVYARVVRYQRWRKGAASANP